MDYNTKIKEIRDLIDNKDFINAKTKLLELLDLYGTKPVEDDTNDYHCFNNYVELLMYWNKYKLEKKNVILEINYTEVYYLLGYVSVELKDNISALEYLNEALKWNPVDALTIFEIANVYRSEGNFEKQKEYVEMAYPYIYSSKLMARYYRDLGYYYIERKEYDIANALYSFSTSYDNNKIAHNELAYIAKHLEREPKMSTVEEVDTLFTKYGIARGFKKELVSLINGAYLKFKEENKESYVYKLLSRIMYDITLDNQFMLYYNLKDEEYGIQIEVPEIFSYMKKEAFEKNNLAKNTAFFIRVNSELSLNVTVDGKCKEEEFLDAYKLNLENMKKNNVEVIKEYHINGEKEILQVFLEFNANDKKYRLFQNYLIVNGLLCCVGWLTNPNELVEASYDKASNSLLMGIVWSLKTIENEKI